jgi:hypothetical protein
MRRTSGWVLTFLAVGLFCCNSAWADSTLHIGTGVGTACQSGCAGDPNLIGTGSNFDIAQVSEGANAGIGSLFLVLAVPNNISAPTISGSTGTFVGVDSTTDIYNFLGTNGNLANALSLGVLGENLTNLEGADSSVDGITATSYGIYTFPVGSISPSGFVTINGTSIPLGTFALGLGIQGNGKTDGTPFTEAGLTTTGQVTTPEPGSLALLGTGLLSLAGILRRRFVKS